MKGLDLMNFKKKRYSQFKYLFILVFVLYFQPALVSAQARGVLISPSRVILEGKTRATTIKIINPNNKPYSYSLNIISTRMDKEGVVIDVVDPTEDEIAAQKMIRFSPRFATIPPKGWQTVRLMVRKPKNLTPGEYRSQLKVTPKIQIPTTNKSQSQKGEKTVGISLNLAFGISIPIIIRHGGESDLTLISNAPQIITKDKEFFIETLVERSGMYSTYFDIRTYLIPEGQKDKRIEIAYSKGAAIYSQDSERMMQMPVTNKEILSKGKIEIEITNREKKGEGDLLSLKRFDFDPEVH